MTDKLSEATSRILANIGQAVSGAYDEAKREIIRTARRDALLEAAEWCEQQEAAYYGNPSEMWAFGHVAAHLRNLAAKGEGAEG